MVPHSTHQAVARLSDMHRIEAQWLPHQQQSPVATSDVKLLQYSAPCLQSFAWTPQMLGCCQSVSLIAMDPHHSGTSRRDEW